MRKFKFHFIGICGISMSALAVYLRLKGYYVQGSDLSGFDIKNKLKNLGIKVFDKHKKENLKNVDIVIYNHAIKETNEEMVEAKKQNLIIFTRAELLNRISIQYKSVIAVAGSHGKTSTTKMIYNCLSCANLLPTLHIGGIVETGLGYINGNKDYFITEACEYKDSFLCLKPDIGVVLNIEKEHLDYFKTFKNEKNSFQTFINNSKKSIVFNNSLLINKNSLTFGNKNSNIIAKNVKQVSGKYKFDCYIDNKYFETFELGCYGRHNINNALATIGVCASLNIDKTFIKEGLKQDLCIKRRFETVKIEKDTIIIHDYAHHPTEIQKTLNTFFSISKTKKTLVVFQPHTFSRTKTLYNKFLDCFKNVDNLILIKTYSAREKYDKTASAYKLYKSLKNNVGLCKYYASFDLAKRKILEYFNNGYNVLILGAGDIDKLANNLSF